MTRRSQLNLINEKDIKCSLLTNLEFCIFSIMLIQIWRWITTFPKAQSPEMPFHHTAWDTASRFQDDTEILLRYVRNLSNNVSC